MNHFPICIKWLKIPSNGTVCCLCLRKPFITCHFLPFSTIWKVVLLDTHAVTPPAPNSAPYGIFSPSLLFNLGLRTHLHPFPWVLIMCFPLHSPHSHAPRHCLKCSWQRDLQFVSIKPVGEGRFGQYFASGSTCGDADKNTDGSGFVSTGSLSRFLSISLYFYFSLQPRWLNGH